MTRRMLGVLVGTWSLAAVTAVAQPIKTGSAVETVGVVAVIGGQKIMVETLDEAVGARSLAMEVQLYRLRRSVLLEVIKDKLLAAEAEDRGVAVEELLKTEVDDKVAPPEADDARVVYESIKDQYRNMTEAEALESIRSRLLVARIEASRATYVRSLEKRHGVKVLLDAPRTRVAAGKGPWLGSERASVEIIVFTDYACPYCARHEATLKQLVTKFDGVVRLAYRNFPLEIHRDARGAAQAAACAADQGKFFEMHVKLFENQTSLGAESLRSYAAAIGLDIAAFDACVSRGAHAADIAEDLSEGERVGVAGTPATFINGRLVPGAMPLEEYVTAIEEEVERVRERLGRQ